MKSQKKLKKFVMVGMLSSIAYLLMFLSFPLPLLPPYLKVDFSDIPALIAAIIFGPIAGITVEAVKNILNYIIQGSMTGFPVGNIANFTAGVLFVLPTAYVFKKFNSSKGLKIGLLAGTATMAIMMSILNLFVFLPAYSFFLGYPLDSMPVLFHTIVIGILPFNIIKGAIVGFLFVLLFQKLSHWFEKEWQLKYIN
ncbi:MAG: ECF transporter S component [Bacillaceae bacterium]|nr:ECF transporter S component [Bacillaceae bacterium]